MQKLEWSEEFNIGIAELDIQHRILFNMGKILLDSIENDREDEVIEEIINELLNYTIYHTDKENEYLGDSPNHMEHKGVHMEFRVKVSNFKQMNKTLPNKEFAEFMANFIIGWIQHHVLGMDHRDLK